ncbi:hypothetical protein B0T16DRAFT_320334 [Cercophora newfieldiana]|uniref:DUF1746 domain-containing protein n=1 Tax=Cercophora newfieldiana TaxID=92897 RepID=A0AA39YP42_9PEZI|nr:hypothetical protein B0T16DRAFT_320334 [Cercophora newfieldiana]
MNNDPAPSFAARQRAPHSGAEDDEDGASQLSEQPEVAGEPSPAVQEQERQRKRRAGLVKKLQSVSHLQKNLDMIVFAYTCTLYYMECSFPRLLLRIIPHFIFISPKESSLSLPAHRPHVFAIFLPNILCVLFHLLVSLPRASEATRGYLHGGMIIDFVGQKPPTWRLGLLAFDVVIWGIQCLMLAVHQEREKLRKVVIPSLQTVPSTEADVIPDTTQDHDAEERGVLRDEDGLVESNDSIELQPLNQGETESEPRMESGYSQTTADLADIMWSGDAVLANFHVVHAVRTVGNDLQNAAAVSLQSLGYTASLAAAIAAERRARIASRRQRPR